MNITANSTISDGSHEYYVNCTDGSGNLGGSSVNTITIDASPPTASFNNPTDQQNLSSGLLVFNATVNDSSISSVQYRYENATTTGVFSSASPYIVSVGASVDYALNITLNLTNSPSAQMKAANISYASNLPTGWRLNDTKEECGTVAKSGTCLKYFRITIPSGTAPMSRTIFWRVEWIENDDTVHVMQPTDFHSLNVTVGEQAGVTVDLSVINVTLNPDGVANISQTFVNNSGNSDISILN